MDSDDRIVGINSTALMGARSNRVINFAIPIDSVKSIIAKLQTQGRVILSWPGIKDKCVADERRNLIELPLVSGLLIIDVDERSPADAIGFRTGKLDVTIENASRGSWEAIPSLRSMGRT